MSVQKSYLIQEVEWCLKTTPFRYSEHFLNLKKTFITSLKVSFDKHFGPYAISRDLPWIFTRINVDLPTIFSKFL
jgi:hypothetical protein